MWLFEDIEAMNPAEPHQNNSFLHHVLHIGAATEKMLCKASFLLEQRGTPHVIGFAQLPFLVKCGSSFFQVRGRSEGVVVDLSFTPTPLAISQTGQLTHCSSPTFDANPKSVSGDIWYTQVTAVIRLWGTRTNLHKAYLDCVSSTGLRNNVIGRVEGWMDIPEAHLSFPKRRFPPLTAQAFQAEVARYIHTEIHSSIRKFIRAYCVANLEELPDVANLYGYYVMVAPGRLACASPPIPIAAGLYARSCEAEAVEVGGDLITSLLKNTTTALGDRVIGQLMAMNRLLKQGESELALIGCVTAIEWFLNDGLGMKVQPSTPTPGRRRKSSSISTCLRSGALDFLDKDIQTSLMELSLARNAIVHGPPPARSPSLTKSNRHRPTVSKDFVSQGLLLALNVYRTVNIKLREAQKDDAQRDALCSECITG
jgi:hypothetical protein